MHAGLEIQGLDIVDSVGHAVVEDVTIAATRGRVTAIVGESGSGKTVSTLAVMNLLPPGLRRSRGRILMDGVEQDGDALRAMRGREVAMIFQEPMTALNPVMPINRQILEARPDRGGPRSARRVWCRDLLMEVGIDNPHRVARSYPHELSGGMRQRVLIAMALATEPRVLLADEPTTALDAVNRAEVLSLIARAAQRGAAVVLVTHDLASVRRWAHDIVVMCRGRVLENGPAAEVLASPKHPYTRGLLACAPSPHGSDRLVELESVMNDEGLEAPIETLDGPQVPWWHETPGSWGLKSVSEEHLVACSLKEP